MAESQEYQYMYNIVKRVWMRYLQRSGSRRRGQLGDRYFTNFIQQHPNCRFSLTRMFDGTTEIMLDKDEYDQKKTELERMSGVSLPDIHGRDVGPSSDVQVLERMIFPNQSAFEKKLHDLNAENEHVHTRACAKAAQHTSSMREFFSSRRDIKFITFDTEVYDKDKKTLLEIGLVKFTLKQDDQPEYFHAIVNDDLHNREGFDNRDKFKFGTSKRMSLQEAAGRLQREIEGADAVVLHAGHHDEQYLNDNGITIAEKTTFDTQVLALDLLPKDKHRICWGLIKILMEMRIRYDEDILHNAGNDAHYTTMAFKALVKKAMPGKRF